MKLFIKKIIPEFLKNLIIKFNIFTLRNENKNKTTAEVFSNIYKNNKWGGAKGEFYSGTGSTTKHAIKYAETIKSFIKSNNIKTVVDLGCGDFNVGQQIQGDNTCYTGIDIVPDLIKRNQELYSNAATTFMCLNIIEDNLPEGELCLIRQVLQHLSNKQIQNILKKTQLFKYVIVTEHYPSEVVSITPNKDKPHGEDTRIYDNSAVYLDRAPFNITISETLLDVEAEDFLVTPGETLKTLLIKNTGT